VDGQSFLYSTFSPGTQLMIACAMNGQNLLLPFGNEAN